MVIAVAVSARLLALALVPGPWPVSDEVEGAIAAAMAGHPWPAVWRCEVQEGIRPALNAVLLRASFDLFGLDLVAVRVLGAAVGVLAAVAACGALRFRVGRTAGLAAGLLLGALPVHAGTAMGYDPAHCGPALMLLGWWIVEASLAERTGRSRVTGIVVGMVVVGSAVFARFEMGVFLPFLALPWLLRPGARRVVVASALAGLSLAPVFLVGCNWYKAGRLLEFVFSQLEVSRIPNAVGLTPLPMAAAEWLKASLLPLGWLGAAAATGAAMYGVIRGPAQLRIGLGGGVAMYAFLVHRSATTTLAPDWRYAYVLVVGATLLVALALASMSTPSRRPGGGPSAHWWAGILAMVVVLAAVPAEFSERRPPWVRGLPMHSVETRGVYALVRDHVPRSGSVLVAGRESNIDSDDLLMNVRLGFEPTATLRRGMQGINRLGLEELRTAEDVPEHVDGILFEHPLEPEASAELRARGWAVRRFEQWELLVRPP